MRFKLLLAAMLAIACVVPVAVAEGKCEAPFGWTLKGSKTQSYDIGIDTAEKFNGKPVCFIKSKTSDPIEGFGTITQRISAEKFAGKRLKFSGQLKCDKVIDAGGLWMRVDAGVGNAIAFDNMENRPVKGTTDWKSYSVVLDVPSHATQISYGVLLYSSGQLWGADLALTPVGADTPVTDLTAKEPLPKEPVNLDFTRKQ